MTTEAYYPRGDESFVYRITHDDRPQSSVARTLDGRVVAFRFTSRSQNLVRAMEIKGMPKHIRRRMQEHFPNAMEEGTMPRFEAEPLGEPACAPVRRTMQSLAPLPALTVAAPPRYDPDPMREVHPLFASLPHFGVRKEEVSRG